MKPLETIISVCILNLGAGVQSTTIALMADAGLLMWGELDRNTDPKRYQAMNERRAGEPIRIDCSVFADTGAEPYAVYQHLCWLGERVSFRILIRCVGQKRNRILKRLTPKDAPADWRKVRRFFHLCRLFKVVQDTLSGDLVKGQNLSGGRFAAIPAFTTNGEGAREGRTKRQCTKEYKTEVIEKTIRREILGLAPLKRIPKHVHLHQFFGMSYDEAKRVFGKGGRPGVKARVEIGRHGNKFAHFPLFDMYLMREHCRSWLKPRLPHRCPRSACIYCPYHGDDEWIAMRDDEPEEFEEACRVDDALRTTGSVANRDMTQSMYVHRSCVPLREVVFKVDTRPKQDALDFSEPERPECGVYSCANE